MVVEDPGELISLVKSSPPISAMPKLENGANIPEVTQLPSAFLIT